MTVEIDASVNGLLNGNRRILAKTITLIESSLSSHQVLAQGILDRLLLHTGKAVRLGITGVPGVGKSSFIESLGMLLVEKGHRVAVLAVDPSSTRSGGSILADKTRMERLSADSRAFIRPSPSGGTLGGVARKTRETMLVCEAAGFDVIIVETVGVGQSEITVSSMVDFFLVLMLAGAGDELQGIKKGVLELADAIAINKADGDNIEKAARAKKDYETALHLLRPASPNWSPPVLTCSARELTGIEEIWAVVLKHRDIMASSCEMEKNRRSQSLAWMWSLVEEGLKDRFHHHPEVQQYLPQLSRQVENGMLSPTAAAFQLLFLLDKS
ncbi:MAG: methylmalonyl Co-A mutase-associated GTPase MeaB [Deltaproteobacteria bacterium]|nr:methylmalonyl Co-A mutase-associated GTPase MeaB [Deltaproteobacteria bacterium]